ncbi:Lar family restriction alleviation protein [Eubacteriales bacterium OttesenSCG-928-A19]|nr:Lar family restriction alleviation protein [Eubacteriales bacterium OttesenSCG-928-A19]
MDDKTIRAAMRGDKEAERACTEAGVALPCPFCGGDGYRIKFEDGSGHFGCKNADGNNEKCGLLLPRVSFGKYRTDSAALAAWNTRAPLPEEPNEAQAVFINHGSGGVQMTNNGVLTLGRTPDQRREPLQII